MEGDLEVLSGVQPGESVVVSGPAKLKEGEVLVVFATDQEDWDQGMVERFLQSIR